MRKALFSLAVIMAFCSCTNVDTDAISKSIKLSHCVLSSPNMLGGCNYEYQLVNVSDQIIKYVTITGEVYDALGNKLECMTTGESEFTFTNKVFEPNVEYVCKKNGIIYNPNAVEFKITSVNVVYNDDTILEIPKKYIHLIME